MVLGAGHSDFGVLHSSCASCRCRSHLSQVCNVFVVVLVVHGVISTDDTDQLSLAAC